MTGSSLELTITRRSYDCLVLDYHMRSGSCLLLRGCLPKREPAGGNFSLDLKGLSGLRPVFVVFGGLAGGRPVARMARQLGVITEYDEFHMAGRLSAHRSGIGRADERGVPSWSRSARRVDTF